jgi:TrkA domain protein
LIIEWYRIEPHYYGAGKSIGDLGVRQASGATIIATVDKNSKQINPGPDVIITPDSTLVVVGERQQQRQFKQILMNGRG